MFAGVGAGFRIFHTEESKGAPNDWYVSMGLPVIPSLAGGFLFPLENK